MYRLNVFIILLQTNLTVRYFNPVGAHPGGLIGGSPNGREGS